MDGCAKEQQSKIAYHHVIEVGEKRLKDNVSSSINANLVEMRVLPGKVGGPVASGLCLSFEQQK